MNYYLPCKILLLVVFFGSCFANIFQATELETEVKVLSDRCVRLETIQNHISTYVRQRGQLAGQKILKEVIRKLNKAFQSRLEFVSKIAGSAKEDNRSKTSQCCHVKESQLKFHQRFKQQVDHHDVCYARSGMAEKDAAPATKELKDQFKKNFARAHRVKWQYFGSEKGVTTIFPKHLSGNCGKYDNRYRPWYVATANPTVKNLVIMIDRSSSMDKLWTVGKDKKQTTLQLALRVADILLSTVKRKDKVNVLMFHYSASLPDNGGNCFKGVLANAGPYNIKLLKDFIYRPNTKPLGGNNFKESLKTAFELLNNTQKDDRVNNRKADSEIFLISDGITRESVGETIAFAKQQSLITKSKIVTFEFTSRATKNSFMKRLATSEGGYIRASVGKANQGGEYEVREDLKPYFESSRKSTADNKKVKISPPYVDAWGLGLMVTAVKPHYVSYKLAGVAGVDLTFLDLLEDILFFNEGNGESYAFAFDYETFDTLVHPLRAPPSVVSDDPYYTDVKNLEPSVEFKDLLLELKTSNTEVTRTLTRPRIVAGGASLSEGVKENGKATYQYHCLKIKTGAIPTRIAVCLAVGRWDKGLKIETGQNYYRRIKYDQNFHRYHRLDLIPPGSACYHVDSLSIRDKTVVKFSAKAFKQPSEYLDVEDNLENATRFMNFMNYKSNPGDENVFKINIRDTVFVTAIVERQWVENGHTSYLTDIPRRFFGTENGVLRYFPAAALPNDFDHTNRPWYHRAVANPGKFAFTPPYVDAVGGGFVVSMSKEIMFEGNKRFGVVGIDLTLNKLWSIMDKHYGRLCNTADPKEKPKCMLVDNTGYIVYHPKFVTHDVYNKSEAVVNKHLIDEYPVIAADLMDKNVLRKKSCRNFEKREIQIFYKLIATGKKEKPSCYDLQPVRGTNIYLLVDREIDKCVSNRRCNINFRGDCERPSDKNFCESPCTAPLDYNSCKDKQDTTSGIIYKDAPLCTLPSAPVPPRPNPGVGDYRNLCYNPRCKDIKDERTCRGKFSCAWCRHSAKIKKLNSPYCTTNRECYGGVEGRKDPFAAYYVIKAEETFFFLLGLKLKNILPLAIGGGAMGLLILITTALCCCSGKGKGKAKKGEIDEQGANQFFMAGPTPELYTDDIYGTAHQYGPEATHGTYDEYYGHNEEFYQ